LAVDSARLDGEMGGGGGDSEGIRLEGRLRTEGVCLVHSEREQSERGRSGGEAMLSLMLDRT
jgi:hypothetical protein